MTDKPKLPPGPWTFDVRYIRDAIGMVFVEIWSGNVKAIADLLIEAERFADETIATVDWLNSLSNRDGTPLSMVTIRLMEDRTIHLVAGDYVAPEPLTCGALRMYAKCLGVKLQETTP